MDVSVEFDPGLVKIDHFCRYPAMLPYVGSSYRSTDHRPTLLLGESNYLDKDSKLHLTANGWYANTQVALTPEEVKWINCRRLLTCGWASPGHKIYREINRCIEETGVLFSDRGMSTVAFMNTFQRPAAKGKSIKDSFTEIDRTHSWEVLAETVRVLMPELVVFTSRFAWAVFGSRLRTAFPDVQVDFVCHPASPFHWHVVSYCHGRAKFMHLLRTHFVKPRDL